MYVCIYVCICVYVCLNDFDSGHHRGRFMYVCPNVWESYDHELNKSPKTHELKKSSKYHEHADVLCIMSECVRV